MTTNAPVGPPNCTREPPSAEIMNPATIAVHNPRPGVTPLAIANAIASGNATTPTITPAVRSPRNCSRSYVLIVVNNFGTNKSCHSCADGLPVRASLCSNRPWQQYGELAANMRRARHTNVPAVRLHDSFRYGQAQARAGTSAAAMPVAVEDLSLIHI